MHPRSRGAKLFVYVLLMCGAAGYLFPFVWLVVTSLKPVEQAMHMPPTIVPRAYLALLGGRETEVTRDYVVKEDSSIVIVNEGPLLGRRMLVPARELDRVGQRARLATFEKGREVRTWFSVRFERDVRQGMWHVTERSETKVRSHELSWDVVADDQIESRVAPRWDNYSKAIATLGGRELEEVEGSTANRSTGTSEDTHVGFATFLVNTLLVCVLGVVGAVLSNALVAYGLAKFKWRGQRALFAITLATMMVPFPVLMVPLYGVFSALGWVGSLYPLWVPSFFGSAFNIFLMRQFFMTIPDELGEAARIDGCSEWQIFWKIILPLSRPVLSVVALFHFLHAWNDFMGPLLYLTRRHTFTLALALQSYQSQNGGVQWHYLMAASAVLIAPVLVLFFFTQKTFVRGIATTGIKG